MMKVLITGATGFIGANLTRRLLHDGHEVHAIIREEAQLWRLDSIITDLHLHIIDMTDSLKLTQLVREISPQWIFHLAVYGAYSSQSNVEEMVQTNVVATSNLLLACEKVGFEAFVNTGSSSEYGFKLYAPTEEESLEPNSYYAVTKASATLFARYFSQRTQLQVVTLRLYSVYGLYEEYTRLIPRLIVNGLKGTYPPLVSPTTARDFIYTDDVVDAYLKAADNGQIPRGAIYNIGSGQQTELREVVELVRSQLGISEEPQWGSMEQRIWDTNTWVANISSAKRDLDWSPTNSLDSGLRQMTAWIRTHLDVYNR